MTARCAHGTLWYRDCLTCYPPEHRPIPIGQYPFWRELNRTEAAKVAMIQRLMDNAMAEWGW